MDSQENGVDKKDKKDVRYRGEASMAYNSANAMLNDPSKQEFEPHTANQTPNAVMQHERPE